MTFKGSDSILKLRLKAFLWWENVSIMRR